MFYDQLLPLSYANEYIDNFKPDNAFVKLNKKLLDFFISPTKNIFIFNTFPRFGKTSYFAKALPKWFHTNFDGECATFTYDAGLAKNGCWTNFVFEALIGHGFNLIVLDDIFGDCFMQHRVKNKFQHSKKVFEWFKNVVYTRLMSGGKIVYVNTIQYDKDPTYYIEKEFKSQVITHTCPIYDHKGNYTTWKNFDLTNIRKQLTPKLFDLMYLQKRSTSNVSKKANVPEVDKYADISGKELMTMGIH